MKRCVSQWLPHRQRHDPAHARCRRFTGGIRRRSSMLPELLNRASLSGSRQRRKSQREEAHRARRASASLAALCTGLANNIHRAEKAHRRTLSAQTRSPRPWRRCADERRRKNAGEGIRGRRIDLYRETLQKPNRIRALIVTQKDIDTLRDTLAGFEEQLGPRRLAARRSQGKSTTSSCWGRCSTASRLGRKKTPKHIDD